MLSLLVGTKAGKSVDVGVAGYEGMTGEALAAGLKRTTHMAVTEVASHEWPSFHVVAAEPVAAELDPAGRFARASRMAEMSAAPFAFCTTAEKPAWRASSKRKSETHSV